jgi:hypothetical protein
MHGPFGDSIDFGRWRSIELRKVKTMANQKQPLDVLMTKWAASSFHLVELMRFFSKDTVGVRFVVLWSLLCAEIILRVLVLLTRLGLFAAVSYGLTLGIA